MLPNRSQHWEGMTVIGSKAERSINNVIARIWGVRSLWIAIDSRAFQPIDEHLMPRTTFITMKEEDCLGLGVQSDGAQSCE